MKGAEKPKKPAKKPAQKTLKERRSEKRATERRLPGSTPERAPRPRARKRPSVHWPPWIRTRSPCSSSRRSSSGSPARPRARAAASSRASSTPSADRDEVARRQALTAEGHRAARQAAAEPSLAGLADVREAAARAARDGVLGPRDLRRVATAVAVALEARRALGEAARAGAAARASCSTPVDPSLASLAESIDARASRRTAPTCATTPRPRCARLRGELRNGKQRVTEELARVARSSELTEFLQERFVTERGGRPVLAVKTSARGKVPGVVHDSSGSGQTLFVEPFAIVELNNRLAEAASAEREEVERILRELSRARRRARGRAGGARRGDGRARPRARVARCSRGAGAARRSSVADEVRLLAARHPLLDARDARCRSTSSSATCACSSSAARTPAARRSR